MSAVGVQAIASASACHQLQDSTNHGASLLSPGSTAITARAGRHDVVARVASAEMARLEIAINLPASRMHSETLRTVEAANPENSAVAIAKPLDQKQPTCATSPRVAA